MMDINAVSSMVEAEQKHKCGCRLLVWYLTTVPKSPRGKAPIFVPDEGVLYEGFEIARKPTL